MDRPVSASVGFGLAGSGAKVSFAFAETDRGLYEVKARRSVGRR